MTVARFHSIRGSTRVHSDILPLLRVIDQPSVAVYRCFRNLSKAPGFAVNGLWDIMNVSSVMYLTKIVQYIHIPPTPDVSRIPSWHREVQWYKLTTDAWSV